MIRLCFGDTPSSDDEVITLAKAVFDIFQEREPSELWQMRLRPYVTNKRLPEGIKIPEGALETIVQAGMCDNAARMLKFILATRGYESAQWNMVTDSAAHSALQVSLPDGRKGFVDPFYGYAAVQDGKLISAQETQNLMRDGSTIETVLAAFGPKSRPDFYSGFSSVRMAAEGDELLISVTLPELKNGERIEIGKIDGNDLDVKGEGGELGITPYWNYMGHKYNREWVRELVAPQAVHLEMTLVDEAEDGILIADPKPQVGRKVLLWDLRAGDKITFRDGLAQISWWRMNSYIGIDGIVIAPIN